MLRIFLSLEKAVECKKCKSLKDILVRATQEKGLRNVVGHAVRYVNMLKTANHLSLSWVRVLKLRDKTIVTLK